jgi:hypothetical protein
MGGTRAAVAASIVTALREATGEAGAVKALKDAGFDIEGTPYPEFIRSYFAESS